MDMIKVKIGQLRNNLSTYLGKVRRGQEVTIYDRKTPIGKLVPYLEADEEPFELIGPEVPGGFADLHFPDLNLPIDPVELLLEDRRERDDFLFRQLCGDQKNPKRIR